MEVIDHNAGASLLHDIAGHRLSRSARSKRYFTKLWKSEALEALREEASAVAARMEESRGSGAEEERRRLFDRSREMETWEFAEKVAASLSAGAH